MQQHSGLCCGKILLAKTTEKTASEQKCMPRVFSLCPFSYLVLLFEAVSLGSLHLVDVLEEVSHPHSGVQLTRVIRRALPPTVTVRRASQ